MVRAVAATPEVVRCYSLSGETEPLMELACPDTATVDAARDRIALLPGVRDATASPVLDRDKVPEQQTRVNRDRAAHVVTLVSD